MDIQISKIQIFRGIKSPYFSAANFAHFKFLDIERGSYLILFIRLFAMFVWLLSPISQPSIFWILFYWLKKSFLKGKFLL